MTVVKERYYLDKANPDILHNDVTVIDSALTRPWTVTQEFTYDGVTFPKGTVLIFLVGLAGRDPSVYPDPMAFDPDRTHAQRHMAFGRGVHI